MTVLFVAKGRYQQKQPDGAYAMAYTDEIIGAAVAEETDRGWMVEGIIQPHRMHELATKYAGVKQMDWPVDTDRCRLVHLFNGYLITPAQLITDQILRKTNG